mmetsp:Transcript_71323/g.220154  ORF Transcript_71323/g.220154 Transcript_71323/m.220154 type:complete len:286 (+) Transcript_71323:1310-2167(+)
MNISTPRERRRQVSCSSPTSRIQERRVPRSLRSSPARRARSGSLSSSTRRATSSMGRTTAELSARPSAKLTATAAKEMSQADARTAAHEGPGTPSPASACAAAASRTTSIAAQDAAAVPANAAAISARSGTAPGRCEASAPCGAGLRAGCAPVGGWRAREPRPRPRASVVADELIFCSTRCMMLPCEARLPTEDSEPRRVSDSWDTFDIFEPARVSPPESREPAPVAGCPVASSKQAAGWGGGAQGPLAAADMAGGGPGRGSVSARRGPSGRRRHGPRGSARPRA